MRGSRVRCWLLALLVAAACFEPPRAFRHVSLDSALDLVLDEAVSVVDALEAGARDPGRVPRGVRWRVARDGTIGMLDGTPEIQPGPVLVIASSDEIAHLCAARLARTGNRPVYVFIPGTQAERSTLVAALPGSAEVQLGEGS